MLLPRICNSLPFENCDGSLLPRVTTSAHSLVVSDASVRVCRGGWRPDVLQVVAFLQAMRWSLCCFPSYSSLLQLDLSSASFPRWRPAAFTITSDRPRLALSALFIVLVSCLLCSGCDFCMLRTAEECLDPF